MLIICPSSLKYTWREEILRWVKHFKFREVQLIDTGKDMFDPQAKIFILSYDLASRRHEELSRLKFNSAIADEAHYLKSFDSKRSKVLTPIL